MKMPWGKHKGEDLMGLPEDYIRWLLENCTMTVGLTNALEDQLKLRQGEGVPVRSR